MRVDLANARKKPVGIVVGSLTRELSKYVVDDVHSGSTAKFLFIYRSSVCQSNSDKKLFIYMQCSRPNFNQRWLPDDAQHQNSALVPVREQQRMSTG